MTVCVVCHVSLELCGHLTCCAAQRGGLLSDIFLHLVPHSFLGESEGVEAKLVLVEEKRNILIGLLSLSFIGLAAFFVTAWCKRAGMLKVRVFEANSIMMQWSSDLVKVELSAQTWHELQAAGILGLRYSVVSDSLGFFCGAQTWHDGVESGAVWDTPPQATAKWS
ncbi:hypothetical protein K439DRAFT_1625142 [Ramaria rubella]|nr:hypothetical protein K439DRAFT_1625142 [Ramaria rubella]